MLAALNARVAKLEQRRPDLKPGVHRLTDEELDGLIDVIRALEAGETVEPARLEWAEALFQREELFRLCDQG